MNFKVRTWGARNIGVGCAVLFLSLVNIFLSIMVLLEVR